MGKTYKDRDSKKDWPATKSKPGKKMRGFTAIEMLVTLMIVAILSVIVIGAVGCSKDTQCESKESQQLQKSAAKNYLNK